MHKNFLTKSGSRDTQDMSRIDRDWLYKHLHRKLDDSLLVTDVDQIEYRNDNGTVIPVAVIELKRADLNLKNFKNITRKGMFRTNQPYALIEVAKRIGVPCYLVCYYQEEAQRLVEGEIVNVECITEFSVCEMGENTIWMNLTPKEYIKFLENL